MNSTTGAIHFQFILLDTDGNPWYDSDGNHIIRIPSDTALLLGGRGQRHGRTRIQRMKIFS